MSFIQKSKYINKLIKIKVLLFTLPDDKYGLFLHTIQILMY
ncbi:hypothetical protein BMQ_pBM50066 (plasmid) [Priestia megaterium QM B1551]|uniref:Uncharacterized protein n=1 Tax=Priestia megaterium (strain ATCC 12872 / QMB1551) TaxID=545693 RepID=D5E3N0_PRIM1|nr:hypothetical protein BMQ_pBM50066 [Priestia megaterium QM B1551]